jgi:hypothetical protein
MAWTLSGTRIFVNESKEDAGQIVPRLQPLAGGTVLQIFGYESDVRTISALVVGDTDKDAIKVLRMGGTATLVSPEGSLGSFTVKNVSVQRIHCINQTILVDGTHACDDPVYQVEVQLYE